MLVCATGELRDVSANLLKRVATNVAVEPRLQPLTGERLQYRTAITDDQARLDVVSSGVWGGRFERVFLDVRVFNPFAQSNRTSSLTSTYQRHEKEKRRHYGQRVRDIQVALPPSCHWFSQPVVGSGNPPPPSTSVSRL